MDYLNGLPMDYPKWTTLKSVANINLTKLEPKDDVIDQQTQLRNICDVTDLIPNWTFLTKYYNRNEGNELLFLSPAYITLLNRYFLVT